MSDMSGAIARWINGRSIAILEIGRFVKWSLRRASSGERLIASLLLVCAIGAAPWLIVSFGLWGWLWAAGVSLVGLGYLLVLVISYLKVQWRARAAEYTAEASSLRNEYALFKAEVSSQRHEYLEGQRRASDRLDGQIQHLEQRLTALVERHAVEGRATSSEELHSRLSLLDDRTDRRLGAAEARLASLTQEIEQTALRTQAHADWSSAVERQMEQLETWRRNVDELLAQHSRLGASIQSGLKSLRVQVSEGLGPQFEERLESWRVRLDNEIADAVRRGRTEDALAFQEREKQLRAGLKSLHDAVEALKRDTQTLEGGLIRSTEDLRKELVTRFVDGRKLLDAEVSARKRLEEDLAALAKAADQSHAAQLEEASRAVRAELEREIDRLAKEIPTDDDIDQKIAGSAAFTGVTQEIQLAMEAARRAETVAGEAVKSAQAEVAAGLQHLQNVIPTKDQLNEEIAAALDASGAKKDVQSALEIARQAQSKANEAANHSLINDRAERIETALSAAANLGAANSATLRKMSDSNAAVARPFDRLLSTEVIVRIEQYWLKTFGLNMTRTALAYMAHKMCLLEDRGLGRIAAPIETIVLRQLALRSLPTRGDLEVLEIGTLFGLGAAVLYNFQGARSSGMHLTLLDPLEGYYEAGGSDPVTGIEVSEKVLRRNLATLNVPASDYRLIKDLSAEPSAIKAASDRLYDYVLVDGDHSTAGVAADFENYGPLVKPGGLIVFDDYGSDHWPGIKPYVDEMVRSDPNWVWIGADYRTAILSKKADGATATIPTKSASGSRRAANGGPATGRKTPSKASGSSPSRQQT